MRDKEKENKPPESRLPQVEYWARSIAENYQIVQSSEKGLTNQEAELRLKKYGWNSIKESRKLDPLKIFLNQFTNPLMLILIFATIVSAVLKEFVDAIIILLIIIGSSYLSFYQEYHANLTAEKLKERLEIKCKVLRDGVEQTIAIKEVVPGDVVLLSAGSLIPADGIVLETQDFYVNQAVLTGETFPVLKSPGINAAGTAISQRTNSVFMGTSVRSGFAKALIVTTGLNTIFGQISDRIMLRPEETSFERGIHRFGNFLMYIMLIMVFLVFSINVYQQKPVIDSVLFSVSLAVGITPVLLPAIVNVTLSKGAQKMAENGVIVRKLTAIENLGSMDILCTDKTGTITSGVIKLEKAVDIHGDPSDPVRQLAFYNSYFESGIQNPLDEAIVHSGSVSIESIKKMAEIPYDFLRKRLSVVVSGVNEGTVLITKGAVDQVLMVCDKVKTSAGIVELTKDIQRELNTRYEKWGEDGFRVLGLAYRAVEQKEIYTRDDESNLILVGFLLFLDPPKQGIRDVVRELQDKGVALKIISGDNRFVVKHVAETIGLDTSTILTGNDLDEMKDEALWHLAERTTLFAEIDPNQKERIILALKKMGHTVGFMGDGINDAPALHAADVGISVENAVDVTKEAADLVLLQQDLHILARGIELGRNSFANTMKYIYITTSANFGNMFSMAGISLLIPFLPMLPMQILLTNFLTDFPAMSISDDHVDPELVASPPHWDIAFIRKFMIVFGITSSVFDYITFFILINLFKVNEASFQSAWFLESVLTELLILLIFRTRKIFYKSKPSKGLLFSILAVSSFTLLLLSLPFHNLLKLTNLPAPIMVSILGLIILYLVMNEVLKHYFYKRN